MSRSFRPGLFATAMILVAGFAAPLHAVVTITGVVSFSTLDNGPLDEDPTAGVFAVSDSLVVEGTVECTDAPPLPGNASGCSVTLVTGGDLVLEAGGAIVTENQRGAGNGGDVTLEAAGDVVLDGPSGTLPGARISTARLSAANPGGAQHAGAVSVTAGGQVSAQAGSVISAAAAGGAAGAIELVGGGAIQIDGLVASGPTELLDGTPWAGEVLVPAAAQQAGGPISVISSGTGGSGIAVGTTGVVVSQGDRQASGPVLLEACGIEVRGLVASLSWSGQGAEVKLRSGEGLLVDGQDLGASVDGPGFAGRLGSVRAGGTTGGDPGSSAELFARGAVQVLGPAAGSTGLFAVSAGPGTHPGSSGGTVTVLSLDGAVTAAGNAFQAGRSVSGDRGGAIDVEAAGDVALDGAVVSAIGNFGSGSAGTGGSVVVQSYQGDLVWTGGVGDVRPTGDAVAAARRGSIVLSYCGSLDLTGTAFPTNGAPVAPFPEVFQDCSLPGPALPPGDALPVCNQPPVAADDDFTTDEDTPVGGNVLADNGHGADVDPGGGPLTVTEVNGVAADVGNLVVLPSGALLTLNSDGSFTYDPNGQFDALAPGDQTTDTFDYTIEEPGGLSDSATVTITVTGVDDDPVAVDDAATVDEDSGATAIDVLANDTDVDAGPKSIQSVTQPANGTVVITGGGTGVTYEPAAGYCNDGSPVDTFTYALTPGGSSATVSVTVTCVDDPPAAVADAATVLEDSGGNPIDVLANDTDSDGGPKLVQSVTQPTNGLVMITGGGAGVTYAPLADYCNDPPGTTPDTFTYTLNGGSTATVSVTVTCVDDPPVAVADAATVLEDSGANAFDVLANDTDVDGGPKLVQSVTAASNGIVMITGGGTSVTYAPTADYCNDPPGTTPDTFTYTLNGGSSATVSVTVTCVNDPPVLTDDPIAYTTPGNTQLHVAGATLPGVASWSDAQSALAKSSPSDVDGPGPLEVVAASGASTNGGSYSIAADGSFTYVPPAGFTGADSFTYMVTDNGSPAAAVTGTVSLTVGQRVWYVRDLIDADNAAGGDGRSTDAFDSLAALAAATTNDGDILFVFRGDTGTTPLSGNVTLENGQKLWGQGIGLDVPGFGVVVAAGEKPRIDNGSGDTVTVSATAGNRQDVEVRGLDLSASGTAVKVSSSGANLVGVTVSDDTVSSAGLNAVNLSQGSTGAFSATLENDDLAAAGNAFDARTTAASGALTLAFNDNAVVSGATGVFVDGSAGGTVTITGLADNGVSQNTVGTGIGVTSATFDATPGGSYQTVSGGMTLVGLSGDGVGGAGVVLTNVAGDLAFTDLDVFADGGAGLRVSGTGVVNVGAGTGTRVTVGAGVAIIEATGGPAVDLSSMTTDLQLSSLKSTGSATTGVSLDGVAGTVSAGSGSSIASATGTAFNVNAGSAAITYGGTISNSAGRSVSVTSKTSGSTTFNGAITDTGTGIFLNSNTGSTIAFTKPLSLTTGANAAFTATGGGTVTSTDTTSTITTTTATALNVANTTIGAAGLKLASVSAGTGASGPASGIVLDNTGSSGSLTVNGGTIQHTTSHGVSLTSTSNPSFTSVTIQSTGGSGVKGTGVTGFSFTNGTIDTTGAGADESSIAFNMGVTGTENNVSGTVTITGNSLLNSGWHGVDIQNFSGTLDNVTISGNTITSSTSTATSKGSGIRIQPLGSGTTAASVTKATIANNVISNFPSGAGILAQGGNSNAAGPSGTIGVSGSPTNVVAITGNTIHGQSSANRMGTSAIIATVSGKGQGNFDIETNGSVASPLTNMAGTAILCGTNGNTTSTFVVSNNVIVANNTVASNGVGGGTGVTFGTSDTPNMTWTIANNAISATDGNGILAVARGTTGSLKVKIQNNTVAAPLSGLRQGIRVDAGNGSSIDDSICLNISGNTSAGSGGTQGIGLRKQGTISTTNDFGVNGMAATSSPGVESYVDGLNPTGSGTLLISATSGFSNCSFP